MLGKRAGQILLGKCKWGDHLPGRTVVVELIEEKTKKVLRKLPEDWQG